MRYLSTTLYKENNGKSNKKFKHLSDAERGQIKAYRDLDYSISKIAALLKRANFALIPDGEISRMGNMINNRPMKVLNREFPLSALKKHCCINDFNVPVIFFCFFFSRNLTL